MRLPARGRAGGKVILLGEHAVVYGYPALAGGLPTGLEVELAPGAGPTVRSEAIDLAGDPRPLGALEEAAALTGIDAAGIEARVRTELPVGRGLGSSAALVVALLRACAAAAGRRLAPEEEVALGRRLEARFHGTPSGIDPAAAALGGCLRFVRGDPPQIAPITPGAPLPLVLAFGEASRRTATAVAGVRERWQRDRSACEALFERIGEVVTRGVLALRRGDLPALGACFDENQTLLERLGVSTPEIERLVAVARAGGALGAKLTGGGGGGAVVAVAADAPALAAALERAGARTLRVTL